MKMGKRTNLYSDTLDDIAKFFSEDTGFERTLMKYKILEIEKFCKGRTMLDIGCGVGTLTKALSSRFEKVVGIDGSRIKIQKAKKNNPASNIEYIYTLFEDYDLLTNFDFIVSANVLEHVDNPDIFLKKIKSLLSPNGRVVMTVPNALGFHKRIGKAMGLIDDFYQLTDADVEKGHKRIYDSKMLCNEFVSAGYRIDLIGGILLKPLSHSQMESWDLNVVDALYEVGKELPDYCSSLIILATHKN
jgi:2-polyprenyl-3-methyl-5-hydroxy-6-metoxy-1,4-benzoquinol methylase